MLTQKSASTQPRTDLPKFALPTYPPPAARRERSSGSASAVGRIASLAPEGRRGLQRSICPPFPSLTERYQLSDNFGSFSTVSKPIFATKYWLEKGRRRRNPYIVQETNVGKTATKMTATIDFAMQFKKLHESGMQVSNICGCLEFHPSCIPAFLRASSICVVRLPSRKKSGESS